MSGLAELLISKNFTVSGSDNKESVLTRQLAAAGCRIFIGQSADNIDSTIDAAVYTADGRKHSAHGYCRIRVGEH